MQPNAVIGYEMQESLGFSVFVNQGGNISIKQNNNCDEALVVLTMEEAERLGSLLLELASEEYCRPMVRPIYEDEEDDRVRPILGGIPAQGSESRSPQSLEPDPGDQT